MAKYLQNKIAESELCLPSVVFYAVGIWLLCGVVSRHWWGQLACMAASTYLMVELSNRNALLRIRSRMVSSVFLMLSTAACFLFESLSGGIVQLCFIAMFTIIFRTYQNKDTQGWTFCAFLCIGLSSLVFAPILLYVPLLWLLMVTQLQSLGWRSWVASLFALVTPYWFCAPWLLYQQRFSLLARHFSFSFQNLADYTVLSANQLAIFVFTVVLLFIGIAHLWYKSFEDKVRIRQLYGFFTVVCFASIIFLVLQPQYYDVLMRIIILSASPIIAHFLTLTGTRLTNILFFIVTALTILLTAFNLLTLHWESIAHVATIYGVDF